MRKRDPRSAGTVGLLDAAENAGPILSGLLGIPTEDEGRQMGLLDEAFLAAHAAGDRRGMAEAIGQQAALYGPNMLGAGIFAGVGAKTANKAALAAAEEMEKAGKSADDIWRSTGWGRGADGDWRFEIDDSGMDLTDNALSASLGAGKYKGKDLQTNFSGAVKHPDLTDAYGFSNDVDIRLRPTNEGSFDFDNGGIKASGKDPQNIKSVLLHEIQHGIQKKEGFQGGGNVGQFIDDIIFEKHFWQGELDRLNGVLKQTIGTPSYETALRLREEASDELSKLSGYFGGTEEAAFKRYQALQGETEARNVQKRMNMNAQERLQTPPWATEDIPRDQQIVRRK